MTDSLRNPARRKALAAGGAGAAFKFNLTLLKFTEPIS